MTVKTKRITESGINNDGKAWSVSLDIPFFDIEAVDDFYERLVSKIKQRCQSDGLKAVSYLSIESVSKSFVSLYCDLLFSSKRELTALYRLCDTRNANGLCVMPKKRLKRYDGFYIRSGKTVYVKTVFPKNSTGIRVRDYSDYIEETV